jgi:hypothetical protein
MFQHDGIGDIHEVLELVSIRIVKISIPVLFVLLFDVIFTRAAEGRSGVVNPGQSLSHHMSYGNDGVTFLHAIWSAVLVVLSVLLQTFVVLVRFLILSWLVLTITFVFTFCFYQDFVRIPELLNIPIDYFSAGCVILNLAVVANSSIFWGGPKLVTQASHLLTASFFPLYFSICRTLRSGSSLA